MATTQAIPHHQVSAQCPACGLHELIPIYLHRDPDGYWRQHTEPQAPGHLEVQLDTCPVCFGAWFDPGELDVLAGAHGHLRELLDAPDRTSRRPCPHGHGPLSEYDLKGRIKTPIDVCATCEGVWLDGHERRKLARATTSEGQGKASERWLRRGAIWAAQVLTHVPVEVDNPARGVPNAVYGLLVVLLLAFVAQQWGWIDTYYWGLIPGRLKQYGDVETLVTYMLLHGSWPHLLGNGYFLYTFGDNVEHLFGFPRFVAFFVLCGVMGAVLHVAVTFHTATVVVGASGAISGVLAAYLWAFPRQRLFQVILGIQLKIPVWVYLFVWIGFHVVMTLFGSGAGAEGVAWMAHLGGFATGAALTPLLLRWRRREIAARVQIKAMR